LVETPFGFHIIRRPSLDQARDRLAGYLEERAGVRLDSLDMDSLAAANEIKVLESAPPRCGPPASRPMTPPTRARR
jgi:hypothetical protein